MRLFSLVLSILTSTVAFSQPIKVITVESGDKFSKILKRTTVLRSDKTMKHGLYQQWHGDAAYYAGYYNMNRKDSVWTFFTRKGIAITKRWYAEDAKTGTWEFFNDKGEALWQYNFTTNTHNKPANDTLMYYTYQAADGNWVHAKTDVAPLWLCSKFEWMNHLNRTLRYPMKAIDNGLQGTVLADVTIDEQGKPVDFTIAKSAHPPLDEEALRVLRLYDFEFIPAEKDGKKVKVKVRYPIVFRLEGDPVK